MKKFLRNVTFVCSVFILLLIGINSVSADTGFYSRAIRDGNGNVRWRYALYGGRTINFVKIMVWGTDQPVYCIEPNVDYLDFSEGNYHEATGDNNVLNISTLSAETLKRLKLYSYYGFGYGNHTDDSWYVATQLEIWNTIDYGSAALREGDINLVESHRVELRNLVDNVLTLPSFQGGEYEQIIGQSTEYIDSNNVISDYQVSDCSNCSATISGNKLIVTSNQVGRSTVNFKRTVTNIYNPSIIYYNAGYQKLMIFGSPDPMNANLYLNVIGGTIKIQKIDSETNSNRTQGDATLEGAKFNILNSDGEVAGTITTNSNGYGELLVGMGEFTIKEVEAPNGYILNPTVYSVNLTPQVIEESVMVKEDVIKGHALITKEYGDDEFGYNLEEGAIFDVINSNGEVIDTLTTDAEGVALIKLPFGKYKLVQKQGLERYSIADDIEINISENKKIYKFNIKNISYPRFELSKYDISDSKPLKDATIEIYKLNRNDTYDLYYSGITNEEGKIYLDSIDLGKYYFIEKNAPEGYVLNDEKHYFEITEYGKTYKESLGNEKYSKLEITKYDISESEAIEGVTIEIYKLNSNDEYELYYKDITNDEGKIYLDIIEKGDYYFIETDLIDEHFILSDEKHYFTIAENNIIHKDKITNNKYSEIEISKIDIDTGELLEGAKIEVYKFNTETEEYELFYTGMTNEEGVIQIDIADIGKYYYKEVEAPEGYILCDEETYFEIEDYNTSYKFSLSNDRIVIEVPDTLTMESYKIYYIAATLFMIGVAIIIYEKTKYKK